VGRLELAKDGLARRGGLNLCLKEEVIRRDVWGFSADSGPESGKRNYKLSPTCRVTHHCSYSPDSNPSFRR